MYNIKQIEKEIEISIKEAAIKKEQEPEMESEAIMIKYERITNGSFDIPEEVRVYIKEKIKEATQIKEKSQKEKAIEQRVAKCFRNAEALLYKYNRLREEIRECEELKKQIEKIGLPEKSKSFVTYNKNNSLPTDKDEQTEKILHDINVRKATLELEYEIIERGIKIFEEDPYKKTVTLRYMEGMNDAQIAEIINCDPATVWRNRQRIVKALAVYLYGVIAVPVEIEYDRII